jgi:dihydrofolate reductase
MRRIRYIVAMSLDGFIAGPHGEFDWIDTDPEVDFAALWAQFDTLLMGSRTYHVAVERLGATAFRGMTTIVFSRSMKAADHPGITLVSDLRAEWVQALKAKSGKDIWLMGGSQLFRAFLDGGFVDTIEVSAIPILLGEGIPLFPPPYAPTHLKLTSHKVYRSGRVSLVYDVEN